MGAESDSRSRSAWPIRAPITAQDTTFTTNMCPGAKLSQPIRSWNDASLPSKDVLELISRAGTDLVPEIDSEEGRQLGLKQLSGTNTLGAGNTTRLAMLEDAPSMLRALEFTISREQALDFGHARLRVGGMDRHIPPSTRPWPCSSAAAHFTIATGANTSSRPSR